ncbi:hypothetical protein SAMN05444369_12025 [Capnocytophaga haemolytica]|jgi:hypothetical protein|uniref:DUF402 domain-containing protein n=1 Tax=Capnocytophaga haemolytica TaxID=45243 RepID=A0AAX2H1S9_9FLAO|nr:hypothetical protein [Capnocytophaga haemolytica]AMD84373.1 hypothetical protein AXF12_01780 [Capnocytophaga haemolytica]SFO31816.1 hypothetical protein SAMN05444369_12025 [Capnocytophaga haemolytica]SNV11167.1 Uncharacterised protein [Capnocytophaga haemolytica]
MPRIYYRERKLHGLPFKNDVITPNFFNRIIDKASYIAEDALHIFELPQKSGGLLFWRREKGFKYAVIWNNEKPHTTYEYGDFYLPKAIVFFDEKDAYFPSDYYFIVSIDNQLELSHSKAGADTTWYEQPILRREVTNPKLIKRFERSMKELYQCLK